MHALVVSPIPSDPVNQGNSARISRFCELLQYYGYQVHFVYYGLEGISLPQSDAMSRRWDSFHYVQPRTHPKQSRVDGYDIDDYCGSELSDFVKELQKTWRFDIAIINYVWASRVASVISERTFSVIDTHDIFGGRQTLLQSQGVAPAWFYCSVAQEAIGLERADAIIAIQDLEAEVFSERFSRQIFVIGHVLPKNFLPIPKRLKRLRVGYLASNNPSNRVSLEMFIAGLQNRPDLVKRCEFRIGGAIGNHVPPKQPGFKVLGFLEDTSDFYRNVDVMINVNISGTGLKIKTVEALSYGVPLITTLDGMCGIDSSCAAHLCENLDQLLDCISDIESEEELLNLRLESQQVFESYTQRQIINFRTMLKAASDHLTRALN